MADEPAPAVPERMHAVTYEMTPDGLRIVADQVVAAEADTQPVPASEPAKPRRQTPPAADEKGE